MNKTIKESVKEALEQDIELSNEEYEEKMKKADSVTKAHNVKGKASLNVSQRQKRMSMNYFGSSLNIMMNILVNLQEINEKLTCICLANGNTPVGDKDNE